MGKKPELESVHLVNHSKCMLAAFQNFRQDETMLDVTLVCKGMSLKAHKLVLSACSPFLKELFAENPCKHPIVILRDFEFSDLKAIIDFVYKGELSVPRERLISALKVAEELQIRGLRSSEPNRERYEKLYNKVCGKVSGRKKRKRHRHNSSDSEEKGYVDISESDQNIESDESTIKNRKETLESQPMDVESVDVDKNSDNEKDIRPVVLRVGDVSTSNDDSASRNALEEEEDNVVNSEENNLVHNESLKNNVSAQKEEIEGEIYEPASESIALSPQFDSYDHCVENSTSKIDPEDEQNSFQEQTMESLTVTECPDEQATIMSSSCLSPKMSETQGSDETKFQDEGKRFVCSKCESVFTSRINFMRHKILGHNMLEKSSYKCQYCSFTTEEMDCLKSHILTHSDKVPYKCSTCSEEFTSEELYKKHLTLHEIEEITLHRFSSSSGQDLISQTEKRPEFRCSICFLKFSSKLRCQFHEKTCQGGS